MNLPDLPKKIKNDEAKFGLKFREWVDKNYTSLVSCTFEIKDSRGKDSIDFSEVKDVQIANGMRTKSDKGNLVRVQTGTIGAADYVYHRRAPAYVVIRYPKSFEMVDIETFALESKRSKKRSLTSARAGLISVLSVPL